MGEQAGTVMEGTVREGIIRPIGTKGAVDIGPREEGKKYCHHISLYCLHTYCLLPSVEFGFSYLWSILLFLITYLLNFLIAGVEKFDIESAVLVKIYCNCLTILVSHNFIVTFFEGYCAILVDYSIKVSFGLIKRHSKISTENRKVGSTNVQVNTQIVTDDLEEI